MYTHNLKQRYEKIERDMRENTNTCLSFLTGSRCQFSPTEQIVDHIYVAHRDALVPLVKSDISVKDKTETIEQFLKVRINISYPKPMSSLSSGPATFRGKCGGAPVYSREAHG